MRFDWKYRTKELLRLLPGASWRGGSTDMNKRILHLIDSGGFYGAEAVILNLSLGLKERGWTPIVGCFWLKGKPKPALGEIAESLGIDIRYIILEISWTCLL